MLYECWLWPALLGQQVAANRSAPHTPVQTAPCPCSEADNAASQRYRLATCMHAPMMTDLDCTNKSAVGLTDSVQHMSPSIDRDCDVRAHTQEHKRAQLGLLTCFHRSALHSLQGRAIQLDAPPRLLHTDDSQMQLGLTRARMASCGQSNSTNAMPLGRPSACITKCIPSGRTLYPAKNLQAEDSADRTLT